MRFGQGSERLAEYIEAKAGNFVEKIRELAQKGLTCEVKILKDGKEVESVPPEIAIALGLVSAFPQ